MSTHTLFAARMTTRLDVGTSFSAAGPETVSKERFSDVIRVTPCIRLDGHVPLFSSVHIRDDCAARPPDVWCYRSENA
jgi:hypothetical protein